MPKHIKNWLRGNALLLALIITAGIIFLSLVNTNSIPKTSIHVSDKVMHAFAYFVLILAWRFVFNDKKMLRVKILLFTLLLSFGIILEFFQAGLTDYRTGDWKDVIANSIGLIIGFISYPILYKATFNNRKI